MGWRWPAALFGLALLAGCVGGGRQPVRPLPAKHTTTNQAMRQCLARLNLAHVRYTVLPNRVTGPGCAIRNAVRLDDIGVPTTHLGPMTCELADRFAAWVRYAVRPAARLYLGSELVRIDTYGSYVCRDVRGTNGTIAGKRSQHSLANAVDVAAFVLADGRTISVQQDWRDDGPAGQFLRRIHASACKRFSTVLSPDYNAVHRDHFHLDMGGTGHFCR